MVTNAELSTATELLLPPLPLAEWQATYDTLHMWTQIVGKVRLEQCPAINHWWGVALYTTANGLTTSPIPFGNESFEVEFDFLKHELVIETSRGEIRKIKLEPKTVAQFYKEFLAALHELGIDVSIYTTPAEFPNPIPFEKDETHAAYDAEAVSRFWRVLQWSDM